MSTTPSADDAAITGTTLIICHNYESGTTVQGTARYSPAHEVLKRTGPGPGRASPVRGCCVPPGIAAPTGRHRRDGAHPD